MNKDFYPDVIKVILGTILLLLLIGLIPDFNIKYKQINLLADITPDSLKATNNEAEFPFDFSVPVVKSDSIIADPEDTITPVKEIIKPEYHAEKGAVVPLEDYSKNKDALRQVYKSLTNLKTKSAQVRIGVMGDSFTEADIITADIRDKLQEIYGGTGVGFIPISSPAANYRKTIEHTFSGWTPYSMVYFKKADWSKFLISGFYYTPKEDAFVALKKRDSKKVTKASLLFINPKNTQITVSINNAAAQIYTPKSSDSLQVLSFTNNNIESLSISVSKVEGFTALGFYLNNETGVYVDNFSVRGSSGIVLSTINENLSSQLSKHYPYNLLILQYGLNVVSPDGKRYINYKKQMIATINHIKDCYPGIPILFMSVGDKSIKENDNYVTHPGIESLVQIQREIAQETSILFWNTYQAMGGKNSMPTFVSHTPPMAAKDYTHINYAGGSYIANEFLKSFINNK